MDFRGKHIDLVGKARLWFGISLLLVIIGMVSWKAFGLNLGLDFKGGGQLSYRIPAAQRPAGGGDVELLNKTRTALEGRVKVDKLQVAGGDTLIVSTPARDESELRSQERIVTDALKKQFQVTDNYAPIAEQRVGPVIGEELRRNAINGVIIGVLLIAAWIYLRYNFAGDGLRYAVAGIVALLHDVLVLVGWFALIGHLDNRVEVDGAFIAALLTVVGYSINDSVVIFDRIRENLRTHRRENYNKVVNDSLLETMSRSINTGMTVLIMLFALLFLGGESIYNFILAMLVGIASGLYSSIFNASMVLVVWHNWDEKRAANRPATSARVAAGTRSTPARSTAARSTTATKSPAKGGSASSASSAPAGRSILASGGALTPTPSSSTVSPAVPVASTASPATANAAETSSSDEETSSEEVGDGSGPEKTREQRSYPPSQKSRQKRRY